MNRLLTVRLVSLAAVVSVCVVSPAYADATDDLFEAAKNGTASEVKVALAAGADPGARTENGETPLHAAAWHNSNPSVIAALIEGGADIDARSDVIGYTPLLRAVIENENLAVTTALIEGGANIEGRDRTGRTPLHGAPRQRHVPCTDPGHDRRRRRAGRPPDDP